MSSDAGDKQLLAMAGKAETLSTTGWMPKPTCVDCSSESASKTSSGHIIAPTQRSMELTLAKDLVAFSSAYSISSIALICSTFAWTPIAGKSALHRATVVRPCMYTDRAVSKAGLARRPRDPRQGSGHVRQPGDTCMRRTRGASEGCPMASSGRHRPVFSNHTGASGAVTPRTSN